MADPRPTLILVVDDDADVRHVIVEFLAEDYELLEAADGVAALVLLAARPDTRLLISDIRMPGMSGVELADTASARWPALRIILISGYNVAGHPAYAFLQKPFRLIQLHEMVTAELAAG